MQAPSDLYDLVPDPSGGDPRSAVLLVTLGTFIDAGQVQKLLSDHLIETGDSAIVATFDVDQLFDYRGRRPPMVFDSNRWAEYQAPSMAVHRLIDRDDEPYYLLSGVEPDFQWERVVAAIRQLVVELQIRLVVTIHGVPMGVPHTRPVGMTAHATDESLIDDARSPFGRVQVPGSLPALLELRLGEAGHKAAGFAIHVPHYLAASEFSEGALTALNAVVDLTGLNLPNDALVSKVEVNRRAIAAEIDGNDEVRDVIAGLEQQYDAFVQGQDLPNLWAPDASEIPSADQLGAELEDFLRNVSEDEDDGRG